MNSSEGLLSDPEPVPEDDFQALLQQMLQSLAAGQALPGRELAAINLQLLGDIRQALDQLQERLSTEVPEEEGDVIQGAAAPQADTLAAVFDSLPAPLAVLDADGRFRCANPALVSAFGFDPTGMGQAEVYAKTSLCLADGSPMNGEASGASRALLGEKVTGERCRFTGLSGEPFDAIMTASPLVTGLQVGGAVVLWQPAGEYGLMQAGSPAKEAQPPAEEASDSQAILAAVLEYLPVGLIVAERPDGKVRMVSEYAKSLLSSVTPEVEGASWEELLGGWRAFRVDGKTPADIDELPPNRIIKSGERIKDEEWIFQREDGQKAFIVCTGGPILDVEGEIAGGVMTWQDVTEHKRSEASLLESEAREWARAAELEAVLDAVPATVWIAKDPECWVVTGNRYSYEMLRMPSGANPSKTALEGEAPVHFRVFQDGVELAPHELPLQVSAAQGIEIRDFEEDILFDDGLVRHVVGNVTPLLDENDRPRGAVAAFIDITGRVRAERALRESESHYRNLFESMAESFTLQDLVYDEAGRPVDFRLLEVNPAFERLTGLSRDELIGKTRNELTPGPAPDFIERLARVVKTGEPEQFELYSEALQKYLDISAYRTGEKQFAILTVDITERKQAEEALHRAHEVLEEQVEEIRDDGVGFEVPERWIGLIRQGQYGLVGAAERAEAIGGRLQVSSEPGSGTLIRVVVPRGMDL